MIRTTLRRLAPAGIGALLAATAIGCSPTQTAAPASPLGSTSPTTSTTTDQSKTAADSATGASSAVPECKAATLKLGIGDRYIFSNQLNLSLEFTNTGSAPCTLAGSPGVSFVTGDTGTQVGEPARREPKSQGTRVTIQPGHVASTWLDFANTGVYGEECQPTPIRGFRVYAPNDTAAMFLPMDGKPGDVYMQACAGHLAESELSVQVVKSGPGKRPGS